MKIFLSIFLIFISITIFSTDYIFFFLGDGMGFNHLKLADEYSIKKYGKKLNYNNLENLSILNTESLDGVTDSAAAITAFMSFEKTNNNKINIDKDGNKLNPVSYYFKDSNYNIAVITSNSIVDASPAGIYAKSNDRNNYTSIANQLLDTQFDLFIGGGRAFLPEEEILNKGYIYKKNIDSQPIDSKNEIILTAYANNPFVFDQDYKNFYEDSINYALKKFQNEKFFIFIEGGRIDHASHAHDTVSMIEEIIAFDKSLKTAIDFYSENPDNTIIIFTADHETGGLSLGDGFININNIFDQKLSYDKFISITKNSTDFNDFQQKSNVYFLDEENYNKALSDNNVSYFDNFVKNYFDHYNSSAGIKWSTFGHTLNPVPLFSSGIEYNENIHLTEVFWNIIKK